MYRVQIERNALKRLKKIDRRFLARISMAIDALCLDPFIGKPLEGDLEGYYSIRIWPYRIVYRIFSKEFIVIVTWIGHRQGAYK